MFGANASATPTGSLLQLRALDWDVDGKILPCLEWDHFNVETLYHLGPFRNYPQITVYHPDQGNGHAFANLGWTGWIGSISGKEGREAPLCICPSFTTHPPFLPPSPGMSSAQTAISEIGVSFPDDTFGAESRFGTPFTVSFVGLQASLLLPLHPTLLPLHTHPAPLRTPPPVPTVFTARHTSVR